MEGKKVTDLSKEQSAALVAALEYRGEMVGTAPEVEVQLCELGLVDDDNGESEHVTLTVAGIIVAGLCKDKAQMRLIIIANGRALARAGLISTDEPSAPELFPTRIMILCPECGNKRCPKATDNSLDCTNSNESGQPGSSYGPAAPESK